MVSLSNKGACSFWRNRDWGVGAIFLALLAIYISSTREWWTAWGSINCKASSKYLNVYENLFLPDMVKATLWINFISHDLLLLLWTLLFSFSPVLRKMCNSYGCVNKYYSLSVWHATHPSPDMGGPREAWQDPRETLDCPVRAGNGRCLPAGVEPAGTEQ